METIANILFSIVITIGNIPNQIKNDSNQIQVKVKNDNMHAKLKPKLKLYYHSYMNNGPGVKTFDNWEIKKEKWKILYTFNLGEYNPTNYNRIKFLGKDSDFYTRISWGDIPFYGTSLNHFNNSNEDVRNKLINKKITNLKDAHKFINENNAFLLHDLNVSYLQTLFTSSVKAKVLFALTWYYKNNNYYMQVLTKYKINVKSSLIGGGVFIGIGTGIKLYSK